ncbi:lipoyl synthase [Glaciimonas immobilis]|uniref:Lipoyl synthase n=1 Tax=Glaciimonas immobilis TaxID=728004 RepID=A0A840RVQ5_9BURK|nr:lipoyl synthase [Glaciimonas immobilis]KAF3998333.1 lipoyl synthase [Glaciimonas immobilis]MBB5201955.1 lipoic acid synthetase [Glaciimonas immobilis]
MPESTVIQRPVEAGEKLRGAAKMARIPIKIIPTEAGQYLRKPAWIRAQFTGTREVLRLKDILRQNHLHTVCEEANCPNIGECFKNGTATFMIMGDICTRRCPFCDVGHGRPNPLDAEEPKNLARTIKAMGLRYVVITSVDRDDLRDGGAAHFVECMQQTRALSPEIRIEILTPDFRGRIDTALDVLGLAVPDIFNHNLETIPRLYREARPGADYQNSLTLLRRFKDRHPQVVTKSGLMLGLGETLEEIEDVMRDLRTHQVDMLTLGQYLQPSPHHLPVIRYVTPAEFEGLRVVALKLGFTRVASGPMVRSSYHADAQSDGTLSAQVLLAHPEITAP